MDLLTGDVDKDTNDKFYLNKNDNPLDLHISGADLHQDLKEQQVCYYNDLNVRKKSEARYTFLLQFYF